MDLKLLLFLLLFPIAQAQTTTNSNYQYAPSPRPIFPNPVPRLAFPRTGSNLPAELKGVVTERDYQLLLSEHRKILKGEEFKELDQKLKALEPRIKTLQGELRTLHKAAKHNEPPAITLSETIQALQAEWEDLKVQRSTRYQAAIDAKPEVAAIANKIAHAQTKSSKPPARTKK